MTVNINTLSLEYAILFRLLKYQHSIIKFGYEIVGDYCNL